MIDLRFIVHTLSHKGSSGKSHAMRAANIYSRPLLLIAALAASPFLSGCSDDNTPFSDANSGNGSDRISFTVKTSDFWNSVTRASGTSTSKPMPSHNSPVAPIKLTSQDTDKPLYLFTEENDGIKLGERSGEFTRSSLTTTDNISSFGVFASLRPDGSDATDDSYSPDYMYNVEVTRENSWAPAAEYLWPNKASLHINAYFPFLTDGNETTDGITALPDADATGQLFLSWVTPADVSDQQDLMWATPQDATASPCDLTFNHALTAIKFVSGSELTPCTVKKIEISDVLTSGTLNLETGEWTLEDAKSDFSVEPGLQLSAADGSSYVAPSTAITSESQTLLLLPQTLSDTSEILLTIDIDGNEYSFNATLAGAVWTAGKTIVYRLSANPVTDSLILDVLDADGNSVTTLESHYTGGDLKYSVRSNYSTSTDAETVQIPWTAEFIDDNGNVIDRPQWITSFSLSGEGDTDCTAPTVMQEPTFAAMSEDTRTLRSASDINTTSGQTPYNLSNSTGASAVENTANCYIVSAPGTYSIPLVYGNAVKNGTKNESAYMWSTHTRNVLTHFINHLGNTISDPYIYNNTDCTPADAYLVWEGRLCLIENVKLSDDKHNIEFEVPSTYIRQGNALIAVRDDNGDIMWSWQIWVTPHPADENLRTFSYNSHNYHIMAQNIGEISGGDDTFFAAQSVKVRFTQTAKDGITPKSLVVTINRDEKHVVTPFCYSFYQWGRKDPMISLIKEWYDADHVEITAIPTSPFNETAISDGYITNGILHPATFMTAGHDVPTGYLNLWNVQSTNTAGVKSIYDPSPVGFKMPGEMLRAFDASTDSYDVVYDADNPSFPGFSFSLPDGKLFMALLGYRQSILGSEAGIGCNGSVWTNLVVTSTRKEARCFQFDLLPDNTIVSQFTTDPLFEGFGVRPIKDE